MLQINLPKEKLASLCQQYQIEELAVFGSAVREDFSPDSDVDFLVCFKDGAQVSFEQYTKLERELTNLTGRRVDLVCREALANPFRRHNVLSTAETVYAV